MILTPVVCTQCGATLQADNKVATVVCEYCRTSFSVESSIDSEEISTHDFEIVNGNLRRYHGVEAEVVIPDGVLSIGDGAFYYNQYIVSVRIPDSVKRIGSPQNTKSDRSFAGCKRLKEINIPDSLEFCATGTFLFTKNLKEVHISPEKLCSLGEDGLSDFNFNRIVEKQLIDKLILECRKRGVCWSCQTTLHLKNGKCTTCGKKNEIC